VASKESNRKVDGEHLVTDFSVLELIMEYDYGMRSAGHVFG
jgi:hypothetical protein